MNWNSSLHKNILQSGICILLCAAILLGLLLPGIHMSHSQPESPLDNAAIREITVLKVGDDVEELDDIVVPNTFFNKKIDGATVAAVSMALAAYMGDNVHDNESGVLTITYVNKHWNNLNK